MLDHIFKNLQKPALYAQSPLPFWEDEYISAGMLENHLNPGKDGASRNHAFMGRSAGWLQERLPKEEFPRLLDLGCGPGLYAQRFAKAGYRVTGIDLSPRSIAYAKGQAGAEGLCIDYRCMSYLDMDFCEEFDAAILIYCDFGVLPDAQRAALLAKIFAALRPGGRLVLDVFTPAAYVGKPEARTWRAEEAGFWRPGPHLCLETLYRYEEDNTFLRQYLIVEENATACYHLWEHAFLPGELAGDLHAAGFAAPALFADVAGTEDFPGSETLCAVAGKPLQGG